MTFLQTIIIYCLGLMTGLYAGYNWRRRDL